MPGDIPNAFVDLPESMFPFTIKWLNAETGELIREQEVDGPGAIMIKGGYPFKVSAEIWKNGERIE